MITYIRGSVNCLYHKYLLSGFGVLFAALECFYCFGFSFRKMLTCLSCGVIANLLLCFYLSCGVIAN